MPCVFPVISLKALSLIRHHDKPAHAYSEGEIKPDWPDDIF
jgi:thiol:disulfide interchange protein